MFYLFVCVRTCRPYHTNIIYVYIYNVYNLRIYIYMYIIYLYMYVYETRVNMCVWSKLQPTPPPHPPRSTKICWCLL